MCLRPSTIPTFIMDVKAAFSNEESSTEMFEIE